MSSPLLFRKVINVVWRFFCVATLSSRLLQVVHAVQFRTSELKLLKEVSVALSSDEGFFLSGLDYGGYDSIGSWVLSDDYCNEWVGVKCNYAGYVTSIILKSDDSFLLNDTIVERTIDALSLGGTLSPRLGSLTQLETLIISGQAISGSIPFTLGKLTKLKTLSLNDNILYGAIPPELGKLATLEYLNLRANQLTDGEKTIKSLSCTIPESFGKLTNLQHLDLSENDLTGTPPSSLTNLEKLTYLDLHDNKLTGSISTFLRPSSNLANLDLGGNQFYGKLDILGELGHLKVLSLGGNLYTGPIPSSLTNVSSLEYLGMKGNNFSSSLPDSFANLSNLKWLDLSANTLSGPITAIEKMSRLQHLELQQNSFSGSVLVGLLESLNYIDLSNNNFHGSFPDLGSKKNLTNLFLDFNNFTDSFPASLTTLPQLSDLSLCGCGLYGEIPSEIGNLTTLGYLALSDNELSGKVPNTIGNLYLTYLDLSGNNLTGSIPDSLAKLSNLEELYLFNNEFSGNIPQSIGSLKNLIYLSLSQNKLTGDLKPLLGLERIDVLDVSFNSLSGQIPLDFGYFEALSSLVLSYNYLDGPLPYTLGNLNYLVKLKVGGCGLEGEVPAAIGKLVQMVYLDLSYNSFSGTLPSTFFTNFREAGLIFISNNFLRGDIPDMSNLSKNLQILDLSNNQFSGGADQGFPRRLISLDLSANNLTGDLPFILHKLKRLDYVNLENNHFYGEVPSINASVILLSNNSLSGLRHTPYEEGNRILQLAGNPLCNQAGFANDISCTVWGPLPSYSDTPLCTTLCVIGSKNAVNPYLYSLNGTCQCAGLVSMNMTIFNSPYAVFTDVARGILIQFLIEKIAIDQNQVFVKEATAEQDGTHLVQLQLFSINLDPPPVATFNTFLAYWLNDHGSFSGNFSGSKIGSLGVAKRPLLEVVPRFSPYLLAPVPGFSNSGKDTNTQLVLGLAIGLPLLLLIGLAVILFIKYKKSARSRQSDFAIRIQEHFVRPISLSEVRFATDNFNEMNMLGVGGYGTVYKGVTKTKEVWAVKRAKSVSLKGLKDFENEVDVISKMAHRNIVRLLGYCDENNEQIFVYEFMAGGTLKEKLRNKDASTSNPMSFAQRVDVAAGAAEGLRYLHNFAKPTIIHRDVKSDNILLGENFEAKIADFGLLKDNSSADEHLKTVVAGTPGYIDPEYYTNFQVTAKSDVYSFGVVLLELITGLAPLIKDESITDPDAPNITALANWVQRYTGDLDKLVDPRMQAETYNLTAMTMLVKLAQNCTERCAIYRPAMDEVARRLDQIKNVILGIADETGGYDSSVSGDTPARAAPLPSSVYSGSGSASQSYCLAPLSEAYSGR